MNKPAGILTIAALLLAGISPVRAKRAAPIEVAPIAVGGVCYSAPRDAMGFVVAKDLKSGRELWRVRIYEVRVDPKLERDVQDVFITSLEVKDGILLVTNERGEKYALDLKTHKVTRQ